MSASQRLVVVLYGRRVGAIERAAGRLVFTYDSDYADSSGPTPISVSMPVSATRYTNKWVEAYLRGLLPDNDEVRRRWAAHFGLRDRDTFGLIAAIGSDAAGAAIFVPEEEYPAALESGTVEPLDEGGIAARLRRLRADETDWLGDDERWSLAGVQSKFTLREVGGGWGIAHGAQPSTHIVKPGISKIPGQALIEHVCMAALARLGLMVAQTRYIEFEDQPAIVVTRFDRQVRDGRWQRIHQEDLCQAFALDPVRTYEADGGPGVQRIADLLRASTRDDSLTRFVVAVIANYLLGAPDAHAKNYSLTLVGQVVQLAPLYDVASGFTAVRDGRLRFAQAAMSIGGARAFGEVEGRHWTRFAARVGVAPDVVRSWVTHLAQSLPDALSDAVSTLPPAPRTSVDLGGLVTRVARHCAVTRSDLEVDRSGRRVGPSGAEVLGGRST